jgi:hypothetical protein
MVIPPPDLTFIAIVQMVQCIILTYVLISMLFNKLKLDLFILSFYYLLACVFCDTLWSFWFGFDAIFFIGCFYYGLKDMAIKENVDNDQHPTE